MGSDGLPVETAYHLEQAFDAINWQGPAPIYSNPVDEASDTSERLKAGTTTFEDVYDEQEAQWKQKLRQRAKEVKFVEDLAKEMGVSPDKISSILPPGVLQPIGSNPREQEPSKVEAK